MRIEKEPFTRELFAEVLPLARKSWDENTAVKGETCAFGDDRNWIIEPDRDKYEMLGNAGVFALISLRDEGALVGYIIGWHHQSMHHKEILCGFVDTMFVEPGYRRYARKLINRFEQEMRAVGAQIIGWPTHPKGNLYRLLMARGYRPDDVVMEKRLPKETAVCA